MATATAIAGSGKASAANRRPLKSRRERFLSVANLRVPNTVRAIDNLARCGNARQYEYSSEEAGKLLALVNAAVGRLAAAFSGRPQENGQLFK